MVYSHPNSQTGIESTSPAVRSKTLQLILIAAGICSVALGVVGIFLPVMPTTIFLILAAACFVRSSDRLHCWLQNHRILGPYLQAVKGRSGMPRRAKVTTLVVLWSSILCSAFIFVELLWLRLLLLAVACGVSVFIWSRNTMQPADQTVADGGNDSDESARQALGACREAECT